MIETPYLAGPGSRLQRAKDEHEMFFRKHPTLTEREYFEKVFTEVGTLPAMKEFFDRKHNPLWQVAPSGDAAKELLDFWRKTDPDIGVLIHDFTDPDWNTRFLGDLYQDLSEAAQKKFALLQTPDFVEEFILDRTLTPAIQTFGYQVVRMIDPTCGSGHFLLDGFQRIFRLWQEHLPGENPRVLAQKALDGIYGVDLNPYAVAIARFRLLLVALEVCSMKRLRDAPDFQIHLAVGDSLLHGPEPGAVMDRGALRLHIEATNGTYQAEDADALASILSQHYHAIVGNPPYITVKDKALSEGYRTMFISCHRKYSLAVPFMERFFDLALQGDGIAQQSAGFVGQITANSFMKREFGKKLIEKLLPLWDLTHIVDTSGAYIPGHTTSTVILFGKNQPPIRSTIRTVLGIRGEPTPPDNPAHGLVWRAICEQIDTAGRESEWVSSADSSRSTFHHHPWSIGGGGAAELKEQLDDSREKPLEDAAAVVGVFGMTNADDVMLAAPRDFLRVGVEREAFRLLITGDHVREWLVTNTDAVLFPYDERGLRKLDDLPGLRRWLWSVRTTLGNRATFGKGTYFSDGREWWAWHQVAHERLNPPMTITWGEIATHNHFVLERGGRVFNQTAPVIKLNRDATEEDHLGILGLLNSSTAGFWLQQVCPCKGLGGQGGGIKPEHWHRAYAFNSTKLSEFPLPAKAPIEFAMALDRLAQELHRHAPAAVLASIASHSREALNAARTHWEAKLQRMIALQEELDWQCYRSYGIIEGNDLLAPTGSDGLPVMDGPRAVLPPLRFGERAFEILLGRALARGAAATKWFELHGAPPITEAPAHWSDAYRQLCHRRQVAMQENRDLALIERPEYKRRWNLEAWDKQFERVAHEWLSNRLEGYFFDGSRVCELTDGFDPAEHGFIAATRPHLVTANHVAEVVQTDAMFLNIAELYHGSTGFSVPKMIRELIENESVPFLPVNRYKDSGLRKRADWEATWELQRKEDAVEAKIRQRHVGETEDRLIRKAQQEQIGDIPAPPKYASKDFQKSTFWKLRGKLDVPKERWISYPGAERDGDPSPLIAWAGWDHLQQAQALAEYYLDAKSNQGWPEKKLKMLLAGLLDLLPWLKQWHNEMDPDYGMGLGDYFEGFLDEECRALGLTIDAVNETRYSAAPDA